MWSVQVKVYFSLPSAYYYTYIVAKKCSTSPILHGHFGRTTKWPPRRFFGNKQSWPNSFSSPTSCYKWSPAQSFSLVLSLSSACLDWYFYSVWSRYDSTHERLVLKTLVVAKISAIFGDIWAKEFQKRQKCEFSELFRHLW